MSGMGTGTKIGFILISILVVIVIANLLNNEVQSGPSGEEQVTGRTAKDVDANNPSRNKSVRKIPTRESANSQVNSPITASGTTSTRPSRPVRSGTGTNDTLQNRNDSAGSNGQLSGQLTRGTARLNEAEVMKTTGVIRNRGQLPNSNNSGVSGRGNVSSASANANSTKPPLPKREFIKVAVKSGDSLWRIAERHLGSGSSYGKIIAANSGLTESSVLKEGQILRVPVLGSEKSEVKSPRPAAVARGGRTYQIQDGDTLWDIASDRLGDGNRWTEIRDANPGTNLNVLKVGLVINLP